jgi:hypothetical protein
MNHDTKRIDAAALLAALRDRSASGIYSVAIDGGAIPVSVQLSQSPNVVFTFIGGVDRANLDPPRFAATGLLGYVDASIVAFSDPSLDRSDDLALAWFAGHEGFATQTILSALIGEIMASLRATRVAFVGRSGGGFAALYFSWKVPGSVAVACNPQTDIARYGLIHRTKYRTSCWPSLPADASLDTAIESNLCHLYASRFDNTVVYLQGASDIWHLRNHCGPFVSSVASENVSRLIVRVDSWGQQGHQPVPTGIWIPWLAAALNAPSTAAIDIERTWNAANPLRIPPLVPLRKTPVGRDAMLAGSLVREAKLTLLDANKSQ